MFYEFSQEVFWIQQASFELEFRLKIEFYLFKLGLGTVEIVSSVVRLDIFVARLWNSYFPETLILKLFQEKFVCHLKVLERQISKIFTVIFERLFFRIFPGPRECIPIFRFYKFSTSKKIDFEIIKTETWMAQLQESFTVS